MKASLFASLVRADEEQAYRCILLLGDGLSGYGCGDGDHGFAEAEDGFGGNDLFCAVGEWGDGSGCFSS